MLRWVLCLILLLGDITSVPISKAQPPFQRVTHQTGAHTNIHGWVIGILNPTQCTSGDLLCHAATQLASKTGSKVVNTDMAVKASQYIILGMPTRDPTLAKVAKSRKMDYPLREEGYQLDISPKGIVLISEKAPGSLYGVQTILQLGDPSESISTALNRVKQGKTTPEINSVPVARITDYPDTALRGANLFGSWTENNHDCKVALDFMLYLKLNFAVLDNEQSYFLGQNNNSASLKDLMHYARNRNIEFVPSLPSGDGGGIIDLWPVTGEGKWVKNATFKVMHDNSIISTESPVTKFPLNPDFSHIINNFPANWSVSGKPLKGCWTLDKTTHPYSMKCKQPTPPGGIASSPILHQYFDVDPDSTYWLTFKAKSENIRGTHHPQVTFSALGPEKHAYPYSNDFVGETNGTWKEFQQTLITPHTANKAYLWSRIQGDGSGTWWITDFRILKVDSTLKNVIQTNHTNIEVYGERKDRQEVKFEENKDYHIIVPSHDPNRPSAVNWNVMEPFKVMRIPTGDIPVDSHLKLSYDFLPGTVDVAGHSHPLCFAEPLYYEKMKEYISGVIKLLKPKYINFNHDEIRGMNRDSRSKRSGLSNYQLIAKEYNTLNQIVKSIDDSVTVMYWDDIINPYHNGGDVYYQYKEGSGSIGATDKALLNNLLSQDILWLVWAYGTTTVDTNIIMHAHELYTARNITWLASPWQSQQNFRLWAETVKTETGLFRGWIDTNWNSAQLAPDWVGLPPTANCSWSVKSCL